MSYRLGCTSLTSEQNERLRDAVKGKRVLDIGCGAGHLAIHMRDVLGASAVTGLDKERYSSARALPLILESFSRAQIDYTQFDVGVLAWPSDAPDLIRILEGFERLVVVSKTTGGTMCDSHRLWTFLCGRELLDEVTDRDKHIARLWSTTHTAPRCSL